MALTSLQTAYEAHEHTWKVKIEKKKIQEKGVREYAEPHTHTCTHVRNSRKTNQSHGRNAKPM